MSCAYMCAVEVASWAVTPFGTEQSWYMTAGSYLFGIGAHIVTAMIAVAIVVFYSPLRRTPRYHDPVSDMIAYAKDERLDVNVLAKVVHSSSLSAKDKTAVKDMRFRAVQALEKLKLPEVEVMRQCGSIVRYCLTQTPFEGAILEAMDPDCVSVSVFLAQFFGFRVDAYRGIWNVHRWTKGVSLSGKPLPAN